MKIYDMGIRFFMLVGALEIGIGIGLAFYGAVIADPIGAFGVLFGVVGYGTVSISSMEVGP